MLPPPRRLSHSARRGQLIASATPLLARHGPVDLSLDEVAARAGVTRNLLYHYFPDGRADLVAAIVQQAERQLLGDLDAAGAVGTGPGSDAPVDPAAASYSPDPFALMLDHALAGTHAWRIHRMAAAAGGPAGGIAERTTEALVRSLATAGAAGAGDTGAAANQTPLTEVALRGYVAFAEAALDAARASGLPREQIRQLLHRMRLAALAPA